MDCQHPKSSLNSTKSIAIDQNCLMTKNKEIVNGAKDVLRQVKEYISCRRNENSSSIRRVVNSKSIWERSHSDECLEDSDGVILLMNSSNPSNFEMLENQEISMTSYLRRTDEEWKARCRSVEMHHNTSQGFPPTKCHAALNNRWENRRAENQKIKDHSQQVYVLPPNFPFQDDPLTEINPVMNNPYTYYAETFQNDGCSSDCKTKKLASEIITSQGNKRGYLCEACGKIYCRKYVLKIHMRTHSGEKPLRCNVCGKCFSDPSNMKKHVKLHSEDHIMFSCKLCGRLFGRKRGLKSHMKTWHKESIADGDSSKDATVIAEY